MTEVSSRALALHLLALGSGAVALIYEVLWMRRFTVLFGATAPATAATLAAMFLGLAIGNAVLGGRSGRWRRPLLVFGLIEIGAGLTALLFEPLLRLDASIHAQLHGVLAGRPAASVVVKLALTILATLAPTFLMGGSLPALAQALARGPSRLGVSGGGLYAINVAGGAMGTLAVPLVLLPLLGGHGAYYVAVAGSLIIGAAALALRIPSGLPNAAVSSAVRPPRPLVSAGLGAATIAGLAFVSGALTLGLEVLWTRMLALVHENSTHSFATVLALYLIGLATGAGLARGLMQRGHDPRRILWICWSAAGLLALASPHLFVHLTDGLSYQTAGAEFLASQLRLAGLAALVVLPAVTFAGAALPCLMQLASACSDRAPGVLLGRVLAWNLLGSLAGPLLAAFGPVPTLGLWWAISGFAVSMMLAAAVADRGSLTTRSAGPVIAALVLALWSPGVLTRVRLEPNERLHSLREGALGIVAVVERDGARRMNLNNYYVIGGTASTRDERWQGHLPLLLHPAPRSVAFLGLGTGITAGAAVLHPVERIAVAELVPEIVAAAREDFATANLGLLSDPRVSMVIDDARTWLRVTPRRFDVIVGDLVVPWRRGESALFTADHFAAARRALATGGLFCQWVPAFQLSEEEFRIVVRTFVEVFPRASVWLGDFRPGEAAIGLVGGLDDRAVDVDGADRRADHLAGRDRSHPYLAHRAGLWLHLVGAISADDAWLDGAPVNRDNRPWVELGSSRQRVPFVGRELTRWLDDLRSRPIAGLPFDGLHEEHVAWRAAGAALWEASLLAEEGRMAEADRLGIATLQGLPAPIVEAVFGAPAP